MSAVLYRDEHFDAMAGRGLSARWAIEATLKLVTAAHFGGRGDSALDMPILRCARTNRPLLPGTSLAGALRAYLLDRLAEYANGLENTAANRAAWEACDRNCVAKLFGGACGDDRGVQSPLIVFDALGTPPPESPATEVRDGVMIQMATGTAADHKKFDFEVLPPGTTFESRFDVLVPYAADENELLSLLCAVLRGLNSQGEIRVGLRRSRGLGEFSCDSWRARRFDLSMQDGWLDWIGSDHDHPSKGGGGATDCPLEAIQRAWTDAKITPLPDRRKRVFIEAEAEVSGELLIRAPNARAAGPDVMHLSSGGVPVLSGTALAGVIRAQSLAIVQLVRRIDRHKAEQQWIEPLFGPREEGDRGLRVPRGSRLRVSERPIDGGGGARSVTRIAIDRFTQGTVPTALFEEEPHVGGRVSLRFEIRNPRQGEIGLLLLALKDLLTGHLPVGGTSAVGRGVLRGRNLTISGNGVANRISVGFSADDARSGQVPASDELDQLIREFVNAPLNAAPLEKSSR